MPARVSCDHSVGRPEPERVTDAIRFVPAADRDQGIPARAALAHAVDEAAEVLTATFGRRVFTAWGPVSLPDGCAVITVEDWDVPGEDLTRLFLALAGSLEAQDIGGELTSWYG